MKIKQLVTFIAEDLKTTLKGLSGLIGRGENGSLARTLRNDTLTVNDLKKCLECNGEELIIKYKGKNIRID